MTCAAVNGAVDWRGRCCLRSFVKSPNFGAIDWRRTQLVSFGNHIIWSTVFVLCAFNSSDAVTFVVLWFWLSRLKLSTNILGCSIIVQYMSVCVCVCVCSILDVLFLLGSANFIFFPVEFIQTATTKTKSTIFYSFLVQHNSSQNTFSMHTTHREQWTVLYFCDHPNSVCNLRSACACNANTIHFNLAPMQAEYIWNHEKRAKS